MSAVNFSVTQQQPLLSSVSPYWAVLSVVLLRRQEFVVFDDQAVTNGLPVMAAYADKAEASRIAMGF